MHGAHKCCEVIENPFDSLNLKGMYNVDMRQYFRFLSLTVGFQMNMS